MPSVVIQGNERGTYSRARTSYVNGTHQKFRLLGQHDLTYPLHYPSGCSLRGHCQGERHPDRRAVAWLTSFRLRSRPACKTLLREAAEELGVPELSLPSRAMHDASWMAMIAPVGMVFVPSKDGLSHTPDEWTDFAAVATGTRVLGRALLKLDAAQ